MERLPADISQFVFERIMREDMDQITFDGKMLGVFTTLDGKKRLIEIAEVLSLSRQEIQEITAKLIKLRLVQPVQGTQQFLDRDFLKHIRNEMSLAVGPIAEILIEDVMQDLGGDQFRFPIARAAELVDLLSREIRRDDKRVLFKRNMVNIIRGKGYLNI